MREEVFHADDNQNPGDARSSDSDITHVIDESLFESDVDFSPALLEKGEEGKDYAPAERVSADSGDFAP